MCTSSLAPRRAPPRSSLPVLMLTSVCVRLFSPLHSALTLTRYSASNQTASPSQKILLTRRNLRRAGLFTAAHHFTSPGSCNGRPGASVWNNTCSGGLHPWVSSRFSVSADEAQLSCTDLFDYAAGVWWVVDQWLNLDLQLTGGGSWFHRLMNDDLL